MSALSRLSVLAWIGLAAAGAMLIGSFGPWAKAIGLLNLSLSGTDGANDGWLVVGAAVIGAAALVLYDRAYAAWHPRAHLAWALGVLLAGAGGAAVTIYDRGDVTDAANENTSELVTLQVGWGLNLAMGASIVLGVVGLIALLRGLDVPNVKTESARQGVASSPNASGAQPAVAAATVGDISELADLHSRGALTDEEFRLAKERMLPRLAPTTTTPGIGTPEPSRTPSLGDGGSTTHRELSPADRVATSIQTDQRWLYGAAVAMIVTVAVVLFFAFTGDNGSQRQQGNTSCPPGQTVQENGYCG